MGPMGLNPPNIYVTSILVRSVQVLCTIGVITAERVAKKAKNEGKLPFYGYFLAIWVGLWRRDSNHSNIYWHPWFGPILSTFGCLEVSFAENSHLSLTRCFRGTSSFVHESGVEDRHLVARFINTWAERCRFERVGSRDFFRNRQISSETSATSSTFFWHPNAPLGPKVPKIPTQGPP